RVWTIAPGTRAAAVFVSSSPIRASWPEAWPARKADATRQPRAGCCNHLPSQDGHHLTASGHSPNRDRVQTPLVTLILRPERYTLALLPLKDRDHDRPPKSLDHR